MKKERSMRDYTTLVVKGMCMGAADIVPGVSGGTIAFILGIYDELIDTIRTLGQSSFWKAIFSLRLVRAFALLNWKFLFAIVVGNMLVAFSTAHLLQRLLEHQPVLLWSLFFGLILASIHVVAQRIKKWNALRLSLAAIGAVSVYAFVGLVPVETPHTIPLLLLSGMLAGCAGILPGISGAFVLLLLGKYEFILSAVNTLNIADLLPVAIGAVTSIVALSQGISWLLHHYHDATAALLTGLMLGSLRKIWPFKANGIESANLLPAEMTTEVALGIIVMVIGIILVLLCEHLATRRP